jgi:hypothetical protein
MNKGEKEHKQFLEQQLQLCKQRDQILEEIEIKLYKMKGIAQSVIDNKLDPAEIDPLNHQLNELKSEVHFLQKQLESVVH